MKKVFYLSTCDTCRRIMKEVGVDETFVLQDIKTAPITPEQIDELYNYTKSYEALLNKRARKLKDALEKYPANGDHDYRALLLMDYTFLKRPVFQIGNHIFIGNSKKTVEEIKNALK